jgi:hypothetical protein
MPAGNWDLRQKINSATGFVEWPTGPLVPAPGEIIVRVEAWVMQQKTGAVQMTYQTAFPTPGNPPNPWIWIANKPWYPSQNNWTGGRFKPGPALGTAIAIATDVSGTAQTYYWWSQEVELY